MKLSCVVLPNEKAKQQVQALMVHYSEITGSKNALKTMPHFSLWGDFEIKDIDFHTVCKELNQLALSSLPLQINTPNYGYYPWRILFLDIAKSNELQRLHDKTMEIILRHRTRWVPQTLLESTHHGGKQKQYITEYGYHFAGEFYSPHFTLAGNDMDAPTFEKLTQTVHSKIENIEIKATNIALLNQDTNPGAIVWKSGY